MEVSADELAGVVDLFGALTREELQEAAAEVAFKRDGEFEPAAFAEDVEAALRSYHLLAVDDEAVPDAASPDRDEVDDSPDWLVPGPIAFPELPEGATDLPHIMDVPERSVDREAVGRAAEANFRSDAAAAADDGDPERIAELQDVSYELEAWAPVDLEAARERLDEAVD